MAYNGSEQIKKSFIKGVQDYLDTLDEDSLKKDKINLSGFVRNSYNNQNIIDSRFLLVLDDVINSMNLFSDNLKISKAFAIKILNDLPIKTDETKVVYQYYLNILADLILKVQAIVEFQMKEPVLNILNQVSNLFQSLLSSKDNMTKQVNKLLQETKDLLKRLDTLYDDIDRFSQLNSWLCMFHVLQCLNSILDPSSLANHLGYSVVYTLNGHVTRNTVYYAFKLGWYLEASIAQTNKNLGISESSRLKNIFLGTGNE